MFLRSYWFVLLFPSKTKRDFHVLIIRGTFCFSCRTLMFFFETELTRLLLKTFEDPDARKESYIDWGIERAPRREAPLRQPYLALQMCLVSRLPLLIFSSGNKLAFHLFRILLTMQTYCNCLFTCVNITSRCIHHCITLLTIVFEISHIINVLAHCIDKNV